MANEAIERAVDDMIQKGRISRDLRDEYIRHFETNLQNDLLRGADYTNKTKQLSAERQAAEQRLQQEYQKLQADRAKLEQWQNQVQGELSKLDDLPAMTAKIAAYEQALRDYQIYDQVQVPQVPKAQPTPVEKVIQQYNQPQQNRFMTMETAGAALRDFALLQSKVNRLQLEHQRLFGEPLTDDLISHYLDTGEDPEQHWKIKYNVDARKQQVFETNRQAEDAKRREEIRAELLKEMALDPTRVVGPLGRPQGGLTPMLEQYTQSRALQHSQPHATDKAAAPGATDFVPPEKRPELMMSRERIAAATKMFNEHFDVTGNPTTDQGRQLANRYRD